MERLNQVFDVVGVPAKGKPCLGMKGPIAEGEEAIDESQEQSDSSVDLALIGAAQKVDHYEIAGYGTARTMAGQAGLPAVTELLRKSLAEEQLADSLLTQIARAHVGTREGVSKSQTGLRAAQPGTKPV